MYEARFTTQQIYDNYKNTSRNTTPKRTNARSLGAFEPDPAQRTSSKKLAKSRSLGAFEPDPAQRTSSTVQTKSRSSRDRRDRRGSTYDEVPQSIVQRPEPKPVKETGYEKVLRVFNEVMEGFGVFDEPTQPTYDTVDTMNVYKDKRYFGPQVYSPDIDFKDPSLEDVSPKIFKDFNLPSVYKDLNTDRLPTLPESTTNILGVDTENPLLNRFGVGNKTDKPPAPLMSPPSVEVPANMDPVTRGLSQAMLPEPVERTADYTTQAGDTLFSIQKTLKENGINTTVEEIAEINDIGLDGIFGIKPGTELKLPMPSTKLPTEFMDKETKAMLQETTPDKTAVTTPSSLINSDNPIVKTITDYLSKGMGGLFKQEPKQELTFLTNEGTTRGNRERIAYQAAYDAGLRGEELRAYMAQVAHETSNYGLLKELGYTSVASAVSVNGKKWASRLKRDNVFDPSDRDAETSGPVQENTAENIFNSVYANRNGNGDFESGDGFKYRGRGYIQLTGRSNYKQIGEDIGIDLENNPELMEDPVVAAKASAAWWKRNVRGKVPKNDYSNTYAVSGLVNRGSASKKANGLEDRKKAYQSYKPFKIDKSIRPKTRPLVSPRPPIRPLGKS